ncbi:MAG: MATE family efflux transporter [Sphingobacteriaceae bacterium]|nr:MATE family efflux transporter [Sphingobacteriaceae bacterium]
MSASISKINHLKETIVLAWPLVITQLGHVVTGMVDNAFLGQLGATEQAAGILCNSIFILVLVFGIGVSFAITPLAAGADEKKLEEKKVSLFKNSLYVNLAIASVCFGILYLASPLLHSMKQPEEVIDLAMPFFDVVILSIIPLSLFFTGKQYCEGLSNTTLALYISVFGNLINIVLNYGLIYGKLGLPELGYMGSAWSTFIARVMMGFAFLFILFYVKGKCNVAEHYRKVKINIKELKELMVIGINSGLQFTFEVAAFVIAGLMAGSFGKEAMDAHGISIQLAAFTYMFASGISSAATIRVGKYNAVNDWQNISSSGKTAIKLVVLVMGGFGVLFLIFRSILPMGFTNDPDIISLSSKLLIIAAIFQLFDGLQVTVIGLLRGLEDVKISTWVTLIGYWGIALPLAYFLAFYCKMEVVGIWISLLISLALVGISLLFRFNLILKRNLKV